MLPVRALYVHVPYCHTICGYCDFYSEVLDRHAVGSLVDSLLIELDRHAARQPLALETVFVGGGTPTTLPADELERLLAAIARLQNPNRDLEFTVEANPATVTPAIADALRAAGVNRVSIGAQSFDRGELQVLERIHQPAQVAATVQTVRTRGIPQINLDLIFAVPGQCLDSWLRNLRTALALGSDHLSCYALTYEAGTPLHARLQAGKLTRAEEDLEAEMYEVTIEELARHGFIQYEISNFARPGAECRHNLVYWNNEEYLGIGPSAAGRLGFERYRNVPDTAAYVRAISAGRSPQAEVEQLTVDQLARETMMLGLRLSAGVDRARFTERFRHDPAEWFREPIERHVELGFLEIDPHRVRLTRRGLLVADGVIADFL